MSERPLSRELKKLYQKAVPRKIKGVFDFLVNFRKLMGSRSFGRTHNIVPYYIRALQWVKNNSIPGEGIIFSSKKRVSYLEVTGYYIPTLIEAGEHQLAETYAEFLSRMQNSNGAYNGTDGREYFFDSAQALIGLLSASQHWSRFKPFALKTADYLISSIQEDGYIPSIYGEQISDSIHVFALPALVQASRLYNKPEYLKGAKLALKYYKNSPEAIKLNYLTHFLAYIIDGFIDMGEVKLVLPYIKKIFSSQRRDGSIPAVPDVNWICSTGIAQFAVIGYKLGMVLEANKAVNYLCGIQRSSGGFYGSYGFLANYFPLAEISWAVKFFIDAIHLKISTFFNRHATIFPTEISPKDGRLEAVFTHLGNLNNKKILDAGCGKGRFAVRIKTEYPSCEVHGIDISKELLREVPDSIFTKKGSILNLPYDSEIFDGVICVEVLEHALRKKRAIKELCRVLKENGGIIIIDKNIEKLGMMEITDFEQWFDKVDIKNILERYCRDVQVKFIQRERVGTEKLFLAWTGIKGGLRSK